MDVWQDTTRGDGHATEQLVELLIVADGKLDMTRNDTLLLVVTGGVACQLQDLGRQVLEHSGEVHWGTSTDTCGVAADTKVAVHTADRELKACLCRAGCRLSGFLSTSHCL